MIIINQNKTEILNADRITEIAVEENNICVSDSIQAKRGYIIGQYKSEERAKEVLEEMIKALRGHSLVEMTSEGMSTECFGGYYEMPEE